MHETVPGTQQRAIPNHTTWKASWFEERHRQMLLMLISIFRLTDAFWFLDCHAQTCKFDPPDVAVPFGLLCLFCSDGQTSLSCPSLFTSTEVHLALVCKPLLHWFVLPNLAQPVMWLSMHWHPNQHQLEVCSFVWEQDKTWTVRDRQDSVGQSRWLKDEGGSVL